MSLLLGKIRPGDDVFSFVSFGIFFPPLMISS